MRTAMGTAFMDKGRRGVVSIKGDTEESSFCIRKVTLLSIAHEVLEIAATWLLVLRTTHTSGYITASVRLLSKF